MTTAQLGYREMDFADYHSAVVALQGTLPFGLAEYLGRTQVKASTLFGSSAEVLGERPHLTRRLEGTLIDAMPAGMSTHWWRLGGLPVQVFNDLLNAATSPDRVLGKAGQLSSGSLSIFLDLWDEVKPFAAEPVVSLTPSGCVVAEWVRDEGNLLAVLAGSDAELTYSLFEDGEPLEESITKDQMPAFITNMRARVANPFQWSDA